MKATWRERLRYRIDNLLARGSTGPLLWLGAATAFLTIVGALVFWALGIQWGDRSGPAEALWRSFVIAIGKGVIGDSGWSQRIATLVFIFASLFLAGSLVGLLVAAINRRLDAIRRGRSRVLERGHTLVLGGSSRLLPVLDELLASEDSAPIVVLAERDKTDLEDELRARWPKPNRRVVVRSGSPSRRSDLDLVAIESARSVIVLNEASAVDAVTVRRALAANAFSPDSVHVVAEMTNQRIASSVRESTESRVAPVCIDATVADMLTQAIRARGLGELFDELLSFDGSELHVLERPDLAGRTWIDVHAAFRNALPLGFKRRGRVHLLPARLEVLERSDRLVVLAPNRTPIVDPTSSHVAAPKVSLTDPDGDTMNVLVLGWSHIGSLMMHDLDQFLAPEATVTVMADELLIEGASPSPIEFRHRFRFEQTKHDPEEIRAAIEERRPDVLVVLGYLSTLSEDQADALTLLTLHMLSHGRADRYRPRVVAQMLNSEVGALARSAHADDFIVTDALVSRMLVHLARDHDLDDVFDDLFDAKGPSARLLGCAPGHYRYSDLRMRVLDRNMTLLGLVTPEGLELNPPGDRAVEIDAESRLAVLGHFDRIIGGRRAADSHRGPSSQ